MTDLGGQRLVPEDPRPTKLVLALYKDLRKAESSILVQARTKHIGLAKFLKSRNVPGVVTSCCCCQGGDKTARHLALYYIKKHN